MTSIKDIYDLACNFRESLWKQARSLGREPKVYLHWTAMPYDRTFSDYHINIKGDGEIVVTGDLDEIKAHTWKRNTGAVGVSLCCAYNATTNNLGDYPPTEKQIEVMAQVIAALCEGLWLTIDKYHVLTHAEAADNIDDLNVHEDYGPLSEFDKWDLMYLGTPESPSLVLDYDDPRQGGNVLRGKANFYKNLWKESKEHDVFWA